MTGYESKKAAALDRDAEIERLNEKIEFLARTNMLYSDWEHRDTQVTSELIRKGIEASKLNAELQAEIERLKEAVAQPAQEPVAWRDAAIRLGEELSSVGPNGYYDMGAKEWLDWAMEQNPKGKHSLPQRPWVGLTNEETSNFTQHEMTVVKYVSKVLQEKNT